MIGEVVDSSRRTVKGREGKGVRRRVSLLPPRPFPQPTTQPANDTTLHYIAIRLVRSAGVQVGDPSRARRDGTLCGERGERSSWHEACTLQRARQLSGGGYVR